MLVNFVIGGTQKGGTSALDSFLRQHPEICLPETKKELHYFDQLSRVQRPSSSRCRDERDRRFPQSSRGVCADVVRYSEEQIQAGE